MSTALESTGMSTPATESAPVGMIVTGDYLVVISNYIRRLSRAIIIFREHHWLHTVDGRRPTKLPTSERNPIMSDPVKKIIFFDLETSGLGLSPFGGQLPSQSLSGHNDADQILSAYFIVADERGEILERMNIILGTRGDIVPKADSLAITGMRVQGRKGLSEAKAAMKIKALFVRHGGINSIVAGHNSEIFDIPRLRSLLTRNGVDPAAIPRASVDTRTEATRAWIKAVKPEPGRALESGSESDSMTLAAACKRHGVPFVKEEAHDAKYDTEATVKLWQALGRPLSSRHQVFDSPYEIEKRVGKSIKFNVVEFGSFKEKKMTFKEKNLTVIGCGISSVETAMGLKHLTDTFLINNETVDPSFGATLQRHVKAKAVLSKTEGPEADKAAEEFESTRAQILSMVSKEGVLTKRGFNSAVQYYDGADAVSESSLFDKRRIDGLDPTTELSNLLRDTVLIESEEKVKQAAQSLYSRYEEQFKDLLPLSSKIDGPLHPVTPLGDHGISMIPGLASHMGNMPIVDRRRYMLSIVKDQGLGWAGNLLEMTEKYGARNNVPGYEDTRLALIDSQLPAVLDVKVAEWTIDELFPKAGEQKNFKASDVSLITARSNGSVVQVLMHKRGGSISTFFIRYPEPEPKHSGPTAGVSIPMSLSITHMSEEIQAWPVGLSKTGAETLARAISREALVPADRSFDSYKKLLEGRLAYEMSKPSESRNQPLIDALQETFDLLGESPEALARQMRAISFMTEDEHDAAFGEPTLPNNPSEDEFMLAAYDDLRSDFLDATVRKTLASNETPKDHSLISDTSTESDTPSMSTGPDSNNFTRLSLFQCKVCLRTVKSRTSIEGIGPKCAKKLRNFIENPMVIASPDINKRTIGDIEESFKTNGDARRYPIMLVSVGDKSFVADVVEKLEDGSLLMINLTRLANTAGTKKRYTKISSTASKVTAAFVGDLGIVVGAPDLRVIKVFGES